MTKNKPQLITVSRISKRGRIIGKTTAAASTMTFANNGRTLLFVKTGATTANLTITTPKTAVAVPGVALTIQDPVVALAAKNTYILGPFDTGLFNDANGEVTIGLSAAVTQALSVELAPVATSSIVLTTAVMPFYGPQNSRGKSPPASGLTCRTVRLESGRYLCEVFRNGRLIITSRTYSRSDAARRGALRSMIHAGERILYEKAMAKKASQVLGWCLKTSGRSTSPFRKSDMVAACRINKAQVDRAHGTLMSLVDKGILQRPCRSLWALTPLGVAYLSHQ